MVRRINLVPVAERRRTQSDVGLLILLAIVVAVLAALGYSYFHYQTTLSDKENQLTQLQAETQKVKDQLVALAPYGQLQSSVNALETTVQQIYAGRTLISETLGDISLVVPNESWFQSMNLSAPDVAAVIASRSPQKAPAQQGAASTLGSFASAGSTYTFEDVARTMVQFQLVPSFVDVVLGTINQTSAGTDPAKKVKGFALNAGLRNTQAPDTPLPLTQVQTQTTAGTSQ